MIYVEVISNLGHAYLPHVYDEISISAPLKGHHIQASAFQVSSSS